MSVNYTSLRKHLSGPRFLYALNSCQPHPCFLLPKISNPHTQSFPMRYTYQIQVGRCIHVFFYEIGTIVIMSTKHQHLEWYIGTILYISLYTDFLLLIRLLQLPNKVIIKLDCGGSRNVKSNTKLMSKAFSVQPNSTTVSHVITSITLYLYVLQPQFIYMYDGYDALIQSGNGSGYSM